MSRKSNRKKAKTFWLFRLVTLKRLLLTFSFSLAALLGYCLYLDHLVKREFEAKRYALPARVYARPLEIYAGLRLDASNLLQELNQLNYRKVRYPSAGAEYAAHDGEIIFFSRNFDFWDGKQLGSRIRVLFKGGLVNGVFDDISQTPLNLYRLEPVPIGGIYTNNNEDRQFVRYQKIPRHLIDALIAVEDQRFYFHRGIDPKSLLRAMFATLTGQGIQGGSTITQQLVKNFFLTPERTLKRKLNEMLMALVVELRYGKNEILEAYLNEVYFGQDGARSIHGVGLASQFYFGRPVEQLEVHQSAVLVAMLKGPTFYNPRRNPERALERRNLVLMQTFNQGYIAQWEYEKAISQSLDVSHDSGATVSTYPSFLDLVFRQLRQDYKESDLRNNGLRIFTTLDPILQSAVEQSMSQQLHQLQSATKRPPLEGAAVFSAPNTGDVLALVGSRNPRYDGFNRALDAKRQIGSLIKPAIYLTALEQPDHYNLATLLDDSELTWHEPGIDEWQPANYDKKFHGEVPLWQALANSYNVSSARLGLELGVDKVISTAHRLGVNEPMRPYASTLLGTTELAPFDVAQMYQTLASGGFKVPLKSIREVLTADGQPLKRYPLDMQQVSSPDSIFLVNKALQLAVEQGTGRSMQHWISGNLNLAGKTGTTDDLRDSWFAGFSGNYVGVVWVGNDDNLSTGLTGASGALRIWASALNSVPAVALQLHVPAKTRMLNTSIDSGAHISGNCSGGVVLPFIGNSQPLAEANCKGQVKARGGFARWLDKVF